MVTEISHNPVVVVLVVFVFESCISLLYLLVWFFFVFAPSLINQLRDFVFIYAVKLWGIYSLRIIRVLAKIYYNKRDDGKIRLGHSSTLINLKYCKGRSKWAPLPMSEGFSWYNFAKKKSPARFKGPSRFNLVGSLWGFRCEPWSRWKRG